MVKREKVNYMIQSVSHAIDVLEELCKAGGEIGVTELSKRLKLHKNNVFRLLATLELRGYVEQNTDTEDYRLGAKSLELGQSYLVQNSLVQRAAPIIRQLSEQIGETVSLAVLQNGQVQYPVTVEPKKPVKVTGRVAVSFPAKTSAVGRLLTAQLPDSILSEVLATNSPQDAAIKNQLDDLRKKGMVIDNGAVEADVVSVSHLIHGNGSAVVGAIEVLAPKYRANTDDALPQLKEACQKLSRSLGGSRGGLGGAVEKDISTDTAIQSSSA